MQVDLPHQITSNRKLNITPCTLTPRLYTAHIRYDEVAGLGLQVEEGPNRDKYVIGIMRDDHQLKEISLMDRIVGVQGRDAGAMTVDELADLIRSLAPNTPLFVITLESSHKQTISFNCCLCQQTNHCDDDILIDRLNSSTSVVQLKCLRCNKKCSLVYGMF